MDRRHFLRAGGFSLAALLIGRPGCTQSHRTKGNVMTLPDEVTGILNDETVRLRPDGGSPWTYKELAVTLVEQETVLAVDLAAPGARVSEVTLHWKLDSRAPSAIMNDQWERTYGDASWHPPVNDEILPWYFLEYDGGKTSGFGVKAGARSMCFWSMRDGMLSLTMDTRSGGSGVQLGDRVLHAADIVVIHSDAGETPFQTLRRFAGMMCDKARMPAQPVYGINDWYFTYGRNSADLILQHTALIAPMAEGLANRPFSVVDSGWYRKAPVSPDDCCWGDTMAEPDKRFGDMATLAGRIKQLGMHPGSGPGRSAEGTRTRRR